MKEICENELVEVNGGVGNMVCFKYLINEGDTLSGIAAKYHSTVKELCELNNIENANLIYAGNYLLVPYRK